MTCQVPSPWLIVAEISILIERAFVITSHSQHNDDKTLSFYTHEKDPQKVLVVLRARNIYLSLHSHEVPFQI